MILIDFHGYSAQTGTRVLSLHVAVHALLLGGHLEWVLPYLGMVGGSAVMPPDFEIFSPIGSLFDAAD